MKGLLTCKFEMYLLCFKTRKLVISLRFFLLEQTLASRAISSGTAQGVGLGGALAPPLFWLLMLEH